jgi:hypothetical protein
MTTEANATETNLESTMRRVRKLLAIAEDSRGDPNECAAAARMAESIMRKYQIEHADVISVELQSKDAFDSADVGSTMDPEAASKEAAGWAGILAVYVADLYECQARYQHTPKYGKTLRFSGYRVDVEVARQTYVFIVNNMAAASRAYLKENRWAGRKEGNSFRSGYISAVGVQIKKLIAEKKAEMQQASSSRALVIAKDRAVAAHFGAVNYRSGRGRSYQSDAYSSGRDAGSKLDVGRRGVGHSGGSAALIGA